MAKFETKHYINGKFVESKDGKTFTLLNPATGDKVADVAEGGAAEIDAAVAAAIPAQRDWVNRPAMDRAKIIHKWAQLIRENSDRIGQVETMSMGRPTSIFPDAFIVADGLDYLAALSLNVHGTSSFNTPGQLTLVTKHPYGVCAGIIPWNVPIIMFGNKAGNAIAAGNAIIIKSSEKAPLTSTILCELAKEAGFPDGLIQLVSGLGATGKLLAEHPQIRKVSFTGSGRTGRHIMRSSADSNLKSVTLELGGKSPTIIFEDADLALAVPGVTFSIAWNSGQICMANSRLYVHEKIYDQFIEQFKESFGKWRTGDPTKKETQLGPQADAIQAGIVKSYLEIGNKDGKAVLGGTAGEGNYINPTIFTDIAENSRINKEEVFGPVVVVHKFSDEEDVINKANDSEFGLYAALYTQDIDRAIRVSARLEAGHVGVNATSPSSSYDASFGGFKQSGIGREGGPKTLDYWLEEKSVVIKVKDLKL